MPALHLMNWMKTTTTFWVSTIKKNLPFCFVQWFENHPSMWICHRQQERKTAFNSLSSQPINRKRDFTFQIDTTELFNSPLLLQHTVKDANGYVEWMPDINLEEATTYYWRVAKSADTISNWSNSSFTYLAESPQGWTQQHYYQFLKNENVGIIPLPNKSFKYDKLAYLLKVQSHRYIDENNVPFTILGGEKYASSHLAGERLMLWMFWSGMTKEYIRTLPKQITDHPTTATISLVLTLPLKTDARGWNSFWKLYLILPMCLSGLT